MKDFDEFTQSPQYEQALSRADEEYAAESKKGGWEDDVLHSRIITLHLLRAYHEWVNPD